MLKAVIAGSRSHLTVTFRRSYAPPKVAVAAGAVKVDKAFVEEDAEKLATHVCINAYIQGDEPGPKVLPDSEYPDWLFKMDLRPPRELEDLDPDKDGWLYWRALRKRQIEQNRRIQNLKTKFLHLQNSPSMKKT